MSAKTSCHAILKEKHWAELRLDQCFKTYALRRPAPPLSQPLGRGSLFASESDRVWQAAVDGTVLQECSESYVSIIVPQNHAESLALDEYALNRSLDVQIGSLGAT